ncbi:hypothetical protein PG996_010663 [Apiospora saccharicola]|uniref:Uncharacterized protein n=1 Tax=Apiospora saccharicola TaxID=335842 RepID=A0ABR1UP81_9PEZI
MSTEQTTKHEAVEDGQREDNLSPEVAAMATMDTSKETETPYDAQGTCTSLAPMILPVYPPRTARGPSTSSPAVTPSSSPFGSALQQPENHHIYDLVCGMLCYLNIAPIISQSMQVAQNGEELEEPPTATSECLEQDGKVETLKEN